ncbi:syntaxin-1A-like [Nelusetta ayraudi]|uniref:syntaxin-1A-like n=1 Tax=Nelusetta ayraudi TaxID=303726 RepID=UPI003F720082
MDELFQTVAEVTRLLEKVSRRTEQVKKKHDVILSDATRDDAARLELEALNSETRRDADAIRARLQALQKLLPQDQGDATVLQRIHSNQLAHLTRCFTDVMRRHHAAQMGFREKIKAQIQRQLKIVNRDATDEQLEEMLDQPRHRQIAIFTPAAVGVSSQALSEIELRHQDIASLQSSIEELADIWRHVAALVESQGELVDNIERNVTSAAEYVEASTKKTDDAVWYKKNPYKVFRRSNQKPSH